MAPITAWRASPNGSSKICEASSEKAFITEKDFQVAVGGFCTTWVKFSHIMIIVKKKKINKTQSMR
jgi:hypothetical protein